MPLATAVLCLVVGITDGDTIKVRCGESEQERVRLTQIDTPERSQDFGTKAKQALSELIFQKQIQLQREGRDRYGRTLGAVYLDGQHINFEMVRLGMAWCYRKYLEDQHCLELEERARSENLGLWSQVGAVTPWEFRK